MKGRKPKPTVLKRLSGNPGRRPITPDLPEIEGSALTDPPEWFDDDQRERWRYVIEHAPDGLLKKLDRDVLVAYVVASAEHRKAVLGLRTEGQIVESPEKGVPMQSQYLAIVNKQALIMAKFAAELGFTPSSRGRVTVGGSKRGSKKTDPAEKWGLESPPE